MLPEFHCPRLKGRRFYRARLRDIFRTGQRVAEIVRGHHEKLNGTGYPDGVTAEKLCLETRIMTVCDIFDALTASDRPYKKAVPHTLALDILSKEALSNPSFRPTPEENAVGEEDGAAAGGRAEALEDVLEEGVVGPALRRGAEQVAAPRVATSSY